MGGAVAGMQPNQQQVQLVDDPFLARGSHPSPPSISQIKNSRIEIDDFPGGPDGFELVSRFCYDNGKIKLTISNVCLLHCSAIFLGMTEKLSPRNLLQKTSHFLEGLFEWSFKDVLVCLKSCLSFFDHADSSGLLDKLITALLAKIAQNSDVSNLIDTSPSSSSSSETASGFRLSSTPESIRPSSSSRAWWFDDVALLSPNIIEKLLQILGAYGPENNSLILTFSSRKPSLYPYFSSPPPALLLRHRPIHHHHHLQDRGSWVS
ncbi:BTB/POZ domain-containing protein At3g19850-like [Pyrus communis]|uniref:BTB/POZ domain-containing protein At3g19850-like n=1 Tax=Pyrus communis TaxID=23211 RepID=UPI0035C0F542